MREALCSGHPIVFGLKLTAQFFRPLPGGFIPTPDPSDPQSAEHGLHAMLLVGYNDRQQVASVLEVILTFRVDILCGQRKPTNKKPRFRTCRGVHCAEQLGNILG